MTGILLRDDFGTPSPWMAYGLAIAFHWMLIVWNPTLLTGGSGLKPPALMQIQFQDKLPELAKVQPAPKPVVKPVPKKDVVKKSHKAGLSMTKAQRQRLAIHPHHSQARAVVRSRPAPVQMPKFVPHASDDETLALASHPKMAAATALRPATRPLIPGPTLKSRSVGVRMSDVHFELSDRGSIGSGSAARVASIPLGEERGDTAIVASAPMIHEAAVGVKPVSSYGYKPTVGADLGILAGKNRVGYVGIVQVGEPSDAEVNLAATAVGHKGISGHGFEIGGPVGDRKILRQHLPEYPAWAEEKGISAVVKIFFTVNSDGTIRRTLRIVRSSGYTELDQLAKEALLTWRFSPTATRSSDQAWGVIVFRFTLA